MSTISPFISSSNIVYSCKYPIVWCPKVRRKVLVDEVAVRLENIIGETSAEKQVEIIEMEITPALACGASVSTCFAKYIHNMAYIYSYDSLKDEVPDYCDRSTRVCAPACRRYGLIRISFQLLAVLLLK